MGSKNQMNDIMIAATEWDIAWCHVGRLEGAFIARPGPTTLPPLAPRPENIEPDHTLKILKNSIALKN